MDYKDNELEREEYESEQGEYEEYEEYEYDEEIEVTDESEEKEEPKKKNKGLYILHEIITYALCFLIALGLSRVINIYVGQRTTVDGHSMESTLSDRDVLIVDKLTYRFSEPDRFDIIVFRPYEDEETYYVKRVIGLPGETIQITEGDIFIDGELLNEDYGKARIKSAGDAKKPITLGVDEYFVLGDNRNESLDSRFEEVGPIKREAILGKAWIRVYPFDTIKVLKH